MRISDTTYSKATGYSDAGVTLLELIIVMVILTIITGFVAHFLFNEFSIYHKLVDQTHKMQNCRTALQMMSRDLRQIMAPDSIFVADEDSIRFDIVNDVEVSYRFSDSKILRSSDLLLTAVEDLDFAYFDATGTTLAVPVNNPGDIRSIAITLAVTINEQSFSLNTQVQPRSF